MLRDLALTWEEVECFIRPQCVLADSLAEGWGSRLLFLVSLHRANGYKDCFNSVPDGYFNFCDDVLSTRLPLSFERHIFVDASEGFEFLRSRAMDAEPLLVPVNIRELYYYEGYLKKDWAHYFIVDGFDSELRLFRIRDNLHLSMDSRSTEYREFALPEDALRQAMLSFQRSHLRGGTLHADAYNRFDRYWLMSLECDDERITECDVPAGIVADYLHHMERNPHSRCDLDVWHLEQAMASGLPAETRFLLMASNQRNLYIKLLMTTYDALWPGAQEDIRQRVKGLLATKNAKQTVALVRLHRKDIPNTDVAKSLLVDLRQAHADIDAALVQHAMAHHQSPDEDEYLR